MGKQPNREHTAEFKQQVADLANRIGASKAADQLGVHVANVQRWKTQLKKNEVKTAEQIKMDAEEENRILRRDNEERSFAPKSVGVSTDLSCFSLPSIFLSP